MLRALVNTVEGLMKSLSAVSFHVIPSAISSRTCFSRSVRPYSPGRAAFEESIGRTCRAMWKNPAVDATEDASFPGTECSRRGVVQDLVVFDNHPLT